VVPTPSRLTSLVRLSGSRFGRLASTRTQRLSVSIRTDHRAGADFWEETHDERGPGFIAVLLAIVIRDALASFGQHQCYSGRHHHGATCRPDRDGGPDGNFIVAATGQCSVELPVEKEQRCDRWYDVVQLHTPATQTATRRRIHRRAQQLVGSLSSKRCHADS